jgi:putative ABC transport system permease protein
MTYDYKDPIRPMFWLPEAQTLNYDDPVFRSGETWSLYLYNIVIWAPGSPAGMEERVRKALADIDPNLVLYIRMALGADRADVVRMVLRGAFSQIGIGLAVGIPAAIVAGRLMTRQLFGVRPWDPSC